MEKNGDGFMGLSCIVSGCEAFLQENSNITANGEQRFTLQCKEGEGILRFNAARTAGITRKDSDLFSLCLSQKTVEIKCNDVLWILPFDEAKEKTVFLQGAGMMTAQVKADGVEVTLEQGAYTIHVYNCWPACDILGKRLSLRFAGGEELEKAYAHFYWDTLVPSVIEKTDAASYPDPMGYVLSTLQPGEYAGTYPDVDHEFQSKGRIALGGEAELAVVRRMMELQFRMMREDPVGLWRAPCAVQPSGDREYHVRRDSLDHSENAEMFLVTGNIEILSTAWMYYAATKNYHWLESHIEELEGAASLLEHLTDRNGKLWSDVYYEDQVIKDGMECMSAAMAAAGLTKLAELEHILKRNEMERHCRSLSDKIAQTMTKSIPHGFWDTDKQRFADWIDRSGKVHDHIHLLANCLPVLFGYATKEQKIAVNSLIEENFAEYQRFPTFLSPSIADYTPDEIGSGGPYDLCAAGRYWCWDASYWAGRGRGDILSEQIKKVVSQALTDGYRMGERYDMNHVYYKDDKNWHGAAYYYEYPCVFLYVLIREYLGIRKGLLSDIELRPVLDRFGSVYAENYGIEYSYQENDFTVSNRADKDLTIRLDLQFLYPDKKICGMNGEIAIEDVLVIRQGEKLLLTAAK